MMTLLIPGTSLGTTMDSPTESGWPARPYLLLPNVYNSPDSVIIAEKYLPVPTEAGTIPFGTVARTGTMLPSSYGGGTALRNTLEPLPSAP